MRPDTVGPVPAGRLRYGCERALLALLLAHLAVPSVRAEGQKTETTRGTASTTAVPAMPPPSHGSSAPRGHGVGVSMPVGHHAFDGSLITRSAAGKLLEIRMADGATVAWSPSGLSHVLAKEPGGTFILAQGKAGFVQRPYHAANGEHLVLRTLVRNGRATEAQVYRPWHSRGRDFAFYLPDRVFPRTFYAWAQTPYAHPHPYAWDRKGRHAGYFEPAPAYDCPASWLADFMITATLEDDGQDPDAAAARFHLFQPLYFSASLGGAFRVLSRLTLGDVPSQDPSAGLSMSPEARQGLVEEVRRSIDSALQPPADGSRPTLFTARGTRTFLVHGDLTLTGPNGAEASVGEGDVVALVATPNPANTYTRVRLLSSRKAGFLRGAVCRVRTEDLVEMQNQMQVRLIKGYSALQALSANGSAAAAPQGADGFPAPPGDAARSECAPYAKGLRPDPEAVASLARAVQEAEQLEKDAQDPAKVIRTGMSREDVVNLLGRPTRLDHHVVKDVMTYGDYLITVSMGMVRSVNRIR